MRIKYYDLHIVHSTTDGRLITCENNLGNWTEVYPEIDLETKPLEIKTDSTIGSGDRVYVEFYTSGRDDVGYVVILFSSTPQYYIHPCMYDGTNFAVSLPTEVEKVWRITLNRNSGIRLLIHCNNVEVVNFLMSDSTCNFWWSTYWSRTVEKIWFSPNEDTASDYFRAGQTGKATYLLSKILVPSQFLRNLKLIEFSTTVNVITRFLIIFITNYTVFYVKM